MKETEVKTKNEHAMKLVRLANAVLLIAIVATALVIGLLLKDVWISPECDYTRNLDGGWTIVRKDGSLEEGYGAFSIGKEEAVTFYRTLPDVIGDDQILRIKCPYTTVDAYIDGKLIYHAGPAKFGHIETTLGNVFALIPLKSEYAGKDITITVEPRHYGFDIRIKDAAITTMATYSYQRISECMPYFILCAILLLIAVISILLYASFRAANVVSKQDLSDGFLSLGVFNISAVAWIIADYHIWGMLSGRMVMSGMINYIGFMLCPILFARVLLSFGKKLVFHILLIISELNFVVQMLLFFLGIIDLPEGLFISQIIAVLLVVSMVYFGFTVMKNFSKKSVVMLGFPTLCFMTFSFVAMGAYILNFNWMLFVALALTFFAFTIIIYLMITLMDALRKNIELEHIKKITYIDNLTQLENRRAYDEYCEFLNRQIDEQDIDEKLCVIMLDVNGLKKTNDIFGHVAGDELIAGAAECIQQVYGQFGRIFRIGGDEFVVIASITNEKFQATYDALAEAVKNWKGEYIDGISISYGKAERSLHPDFTIDQLLELADKRMYEHKQHYYASQLLVNRELEENSDEETRMKLRKQHSGDFVLSKYTMPIIRQMAEVIPGGFFIYREDAVRELIYLNSKVLDIYGCKNLEEFRNLTGYTFQGMVHPEDFARIQNSIDTQIDSEDSDGMDHVTYRIVRADGVVRIVDDYGHFSHSDDYGDIYYVFISDITDREKMR